jgi:hypothetical protein
MQMNTLIAAGLFENPWIIALIMIVAAIANWVAQRRQQKQQEKPLEEEDTLSPSGKPSEEFDVEATLRRLLGEEPVPPAAPPPIHRPPPRPVESWSTEGDWTNVPTPPRFEPPPIVFAPPPAGNPETVEAIARQYDLQSMAAGRIVPVVDRRHTRRSHAQTHHGWNWRNRQSVRQAFVASLVFSPPKGLEP